MQGNGCPCVEVRGTGNTTHAYNPAVWERRAATSAAGVGQSKVSWFALVQPLGCMTPTGAAPTSDVYTDGALYWSFFGAFIWTALL